MELLETQDPEKKRLIETSERHKHELQKEVKAMSDKTEQVVKNALIIGGTLAITYLIVSQLGGGSSKKKSKKAKSKIVGEENEESINNDQDSYSPPSFLSQLGDRVVSQATLVLLDIAKDKLAEYLSNRKTKE
jgi:H+/gluconate symporter-like permease